MHASTLKHGVFAVLLGFFLTSTASAQFEGRLYLDKDEYQVGEPVYLGFDLTNNGNRTNARLFTGKQLFLLRWIPN